MDDKSPSMSRGRSRYKDFGAAKADASHSAFTGMVFRFRAILFGATGVLAILVLYLDLNGEYMSASRGYMLTGCGVALLSAGLFLRLWASLYIVHSRNKKLVCSGPYGIVRNPLYLGNFIAVAGAMIATGSFFATVIVMGGMSFVYYYTIKFEDERLAQYFGDQFLDFRKKVPRMLPSLESLQNLVTNEKFDTISYNNVGKELLRGLQALAVVFAVWGLTFLVRQSLV